MIHSVMAFFCADDPDALMVPVWQLTLAEADADPDEPDELDELPQATSAATPATETASTCVVRVTFTLFLP